MKQTIQNIIAPLAGIICGSLLLISETEANANLGPATLMMIAQNKAIQSRLGAKSPQILAGMFERGCMFACMKEKNCLAYTFDANDGSCKLWDHQVIELVDRLNAKSWIRCMHYPTILPLTNALSVLVQGSA